MVIATDYGFQNPVGTVARTGAGAGIGDDFDTFLRMLTAQIANQDPLNPMEGADFAVQLATFSGVEQQARTNQLLEALAGRMGGADLAQISGWIGKLARSPGPVWFGAEPVTLDIQPAPGADEVVLVVRDGFDRVIGREAIGAGAGQIDWYGRDASGAKLADGVYRFEIESMQDGALIATRAVESYARVTEARIENGQSLLVFEGGAEVPVADVTALRAAPG